MQKFSGKPVWKINGTRLFGSSQRKTSGSNGTSEKVVLFFRKEYSNRKFAFHFFQAISLIPVSGLRGRFPVNRTDLICTNGKRDSGTKLTSPEFLRTICLNRGPTGLPMQMVNNSSQCECVPLARAPLLFARQNVFLFNKGGRNLLHNRTKQSRLDWSASSATIFIGRF